MPFTSPHAVADAAVTSLARPSRPRRRPVVSSDRPNTAPGVVFAATQHSSVLLIAAPPNLTQSPRYRQIRNPDTKQRGHDRRVVTAPTRRDSVTGADPQARASDATRRVRRDISHRSPVAPWV